jgi:hypothetical protein
MEFWYTNNNNNTDWEQHNWTGMHISLLHPLGTMSHKVNEGDLKKNIQSKLIYMKAKT